MMKKWMAAALAAVMMLSMSAMALSQESGASRITVQGTAKVQAEPDMVTVTANSSVTDETVSGAQEQIHAIVAKATEALLALGILSDDIVTSDYSYYPRYDYEANVITGYEASHTLSIICRDISMLDKVIAVVTDSGFSHVYNVGFDVSTRAELYRQALDQAILRAEEKAVRMAQTAGLTITGLAELSEMGGHNEGYAMNAAADMMVMKSAGGATGIRSGMIEVSAGVTAVYEGKR